MSTHDLKTHQTWFDRVFTGDKTAEVRKHDRDFQVGDVLHLIETWEGDGQHRNEEGETSWHTKGRATGREFNVKVTHVLPAEHFPMGLQPGYCLLSFCALP